MIGPYRVLHQIGSGVLGPVFRVLDPDADTIVALKLFKFDWPPEQAHALAGGLQTLIETLPAHPSIVAPLAAGLDGGTAWLAQDLAAADGLDARMRRRTAVGAEALVAVLRQAASAIDTAAEAGWRHGALHPRDVLVDTTGRVRVTGIGIAQVVERFGARPPRRRPYGAPERTAGQAWDVRADVFALGVIAAEWLAPRRGRPGAEPLAVTLERSGFDGEAAVRVLEAATAARPEDRPPTALAFVDALGTAIDVARLARTRTPAPGLLFGSVERAEPAEVSPDSPTLVGVEVRGAEEDAQFQAEDAADAGPGELAETAAEPETVRADHGSEGAGLREERGEEDLQLAEPGSEAAGGRGPEHAQLREPLHDVARFREGQDEDLRFRKEQDRDVRFGEQQDSDARFGEEKNDDVQPRDDADGAAGHRTSRVDPLDRPFEPGLVDIAEPPADPWGLSPPLAAAPVASRLTTSHWLLSLAVVLLAGLAVGFLLGRWSVRPVAPAVQVAPAAEEAPPSTSEVRDEPVLPEPPSGPAAGQPAAVAPAAPGPVTPVAPRTQAAAPKPVDGRVLVRTTPSGARVRMDGRDRGTTPLTVRGLDAGEYRLEISRQGYATETRRVSITGRSPSATVDVRLRAERAATPAPAARASLEFVTRPAGARVWLDGRDVGVTPLRLADVPPGSRSVRFELAGHAPWLSTITLAAGESRRVAASLEPVR